MVVPEGLHRYANLAGIDHMDNEHVAARLLVNQRKVDCCAMCEMFPSTSSLTGHCGVQAAEQMSLPVDFSRIDVVGRIREEMAAESDDDDFTVAKKHDREIPSMVCCAASGKLCA